MAPKARGWKQLFMSFSVSTFPTINLLDLPKANPKNDKKLKQTPSEETCEFEVMVTI
jgi:hypothetical protein